MIVKDLVESIVPDLVPDLGDKPVLRLFPLIITDDERVIITDNENILVVEK
ncbi:hypothetical protein [Alteromonas alba]|uniref:hypothetical protein n=1 Tax=Alteromonas alba TaxID=2079529 RepID=UPI00147833D7|nr:hypothetical protein [Alteromonas alba]